MGGIRLISLVAMGKPVWKNCHLAYLEHLRQLR